MTPVAFFFFNRPAAIRKTFPAIRQQRPSTLFLIADGPRTSVLEDAELCRECREAVSSMIDWPCEVIRNYSETNMGCRNRMASGITWVFEQTEEAIILEDDCLPDPTFFEFTRIMLERYRDEPSVMAISGTNLLSLKAGSDSYFFSRIGSIWGWASWRRAWRHYDVDIASWPDFKATNQLSKLLPTQQMADYWLKRFDQTYAGRIDTWDYQWVYAIFRQRGLCAIPERNMIQNIGFSADATHTRDPGNPFADVPARAMRFPLRHPKQIEENRKLDRILFRRVFSPSLAVRICRRIRQMKWIQSRSLPFTR